MTVAHHELGLRASDREVRDFLRVQANGVPYGIRTRVAAVKGQCPRPLDEGNEATRAVAIPT